MRGSGSTTHEDGSFTKALGRRRIAESNLTAAKHGAVYMSPPFSTPSAPPPLTTAGLPVARRQNLAIVLRQRPPTEGRSVRYWAPQTTGNGGNTNELYTTKHYKRRHYKCTAVSCQSPQRQKSRKTGLQPSHWGPRPASLQSGGVAWPSGRAGTTSWPACRSDQTTAWRTHWSQTSAEEVGACARRSRWATSRRRSEVRTPNQKHGARCY